MNRCSINLLSGSPDDPQLPDGSTALAQLSLYSLLDSWSGMNEETCRADQVDQLRGQIIEIFNRHASAEQWFQIWRSKHPGARLC
jgi:hypothetical protein